MTSDLVRLTDAAQMLAEAQSLPDIRKVHNLAQRAQDYARAARLGLDAQNSAAAIRLEAEAKAGELLIRMEKHPGGRPSDNRSQTASGSEPATLADLGVTPDESSRWQTVAGIPAETRAAYVAESQQAESEVTRAGLLRRAGVKATPAPRDAVHTMTPPIDARQRIARAHLFEHLQQARIDVDAVSDNLTQADLDALAGHLDYIRFRLFDIGDGPVLREVSNGS